MKKVLNVIKKIFSSYNLLIIFLIITSGISLTYASIIKSTNKCYSFYSYNEYISISSGTITYTTASTMFEGNNISYYSDTDILITQYTMGYYFKVDEKYEPIIENTMSFDEEVSLKNIIDSIDGFDFITPSRGENLNISYDQRNLVNSNLYFRITYKTSNDAEEEIISTHVLVSKID